MQQFLWDAFFGMMQYHNLRKLEYQYSDEIFKSPNSVKYTALQRSQLEFSAELHKNGPEIMHKKIMQSKMRKLSQFLPVRQSFSSMQKLLHNQRHADITLA